jgi:hypothetical protein
VSTPPRRVVLDPDFYPMLARQLPLDRTETSASVADFADYEMPRIVRKFEDEWEQQVPYPQLANARQVTMDGHVVYAYTVIAQLRDDGNIHLMRVEIDNSSWPDEDEFA